MGGEEKNQGKYDNLRQEPKWDGGGCIIQVMHESKGSLRKRMMRGREKDASQSHLKSIVILQDLLPHILFFSSTSCSLSVWLWGNSSGKIEKASSCFFQVLFSLTTCESQVSLCFSLSLSQLPSLSRSSSFKPSLCLWLRVIDLFPSLVLVWKRVGKRRKLKRIAKVREKQEKVWNRKKDKHDLQNHKKTGGRGGEKTRELRWKESGHPLNCIPNVHSSPVSSYSSDQSVCLFLVLTCLSWVSEFLPSVLIYTHCFFFLLEADTVHVDLPVNVFSCQRGI